MNPASVPPRPVGNRILHEDMSKMTHAEALICVDEYHGKIDALLPESKHKHIAIQHIQKVLNQTPKLDLLCLNYVRLIKHYRQELLGKQGPGIAHDLLTLSVLLLDQPGIDLDIHRAMKKARSLYDRNEKRIGLAIRELKPKKD